MKKFKTPEINVEELDVVDVISASTTDCTSDNTACEYDMGL